jgi:hypothetical protein
LAPRRKCNTRWYSACCNQRLSQRAAGLIRREKNKILKKILPTTPKNQGDMLIRWYRLAGRFSMIGLAADTSRARVTSSRREAALRLSTLVVAGLIFRPLLINTWTTFTHGH